MSSGPDELTAVPRSQQHTRAPAAQVERALEGHVLATTELMGMFER